MPTKIYPQIDHLWSEIAGQFDRRQLPHKRRYFKQHCTVLNITRITGKKPIRRQAKDNCDEQMTRCLKMTQSICCLVSPSWCPNEELADNADLKWSVLLTMKRDFFVTVFCDHFTMQVVLKLLRNIPELLPCDGHLQAAVDENFSSKQLP